MDAPSLTVRRARELRRRLSLPEALLWRAIRPRDWPDLKFRRQHPVGPYILDFYCDEQRLAVEVDGYSHGVGEQPLRDERRDAWLAKHDIRVLRLSAELVLS